MLTQNDIKLINALKSSKQRKKLGFFTVEGQKMVEELMLSPSYKIHFIAATAEWLEKHNDSSFPVKEITQKALQKLSNFTTANEVLAVVHLPQQKKLNIQSDKLYLVLDILQDPGNMGTILRTAEWFGIRDIICSEDTVDCFNPKVVQASMGSVFRIQCHYIHLPNFLAAQQMPVYGLVLDGKNIYEQKLHQEGFIIIGNESKGISPEVRQHITSPLYIPSAASSKAESLNASIATAIVCAIFART